MVVAEAPRREAKGPHLEKSLYFFKLGRCRQSLERVLAEQGLRPQARMHPIMVG